MRLQGIVDPGDYHILLVYGVACAWNSASDSTMSRSKAEHLLMNELHYSRERAQFIAKQFDKDGDGKLSTKEMERFKNSVKQTSVVTVVLSQILSKLILINRMKDNGQRDCRRCRIY